MSKNLRKKEIRINGCRDSIITIDIDVDGVQDVKDAVDGYEVDNNENEQDAELQLLILSVNEIVETAKREPPARLRISVSQSEFRRSYLFIRASISVLCTCTIEEPHSNSRNFEILVDQNCIQPPSSMTQNSYHLFSR
ncbi:hypothetical protein Trydic_g1108 [Trypoxylus dichotomus]